jgi:hypothetical protein
MGQLIDQQIKEWIDANNRPCRKWQTFCCSIGAVASGVKAAEIISAKTEDYLKCEQLKSRIESRIIEKKLGRVKLFIYNEEALNTILDQKENKRFLFRLGYYQQIDNEQIIDELIFRIRQENDFPHEIGLFLGYPMKDVLGFMGYSDQPLIKTQGWKMYGDTTNSEELHYRITEVKKIIRTYVAELKNIS